MSKLSAVELQFRTAAFGGFQKQDVLDYIETVSREHAARLESLEKERDEARRSGEELQARLSEAEGARSDLSGQVGTLTDRLAEAERALEEIRAEIARQQDLRAEAELRAEELEQRLKRAEPAAAAYESVKDRTAGIELEAHHRAMEVEAAARAQVKATKVELEQWIHKVRAGYDRLRTDVDATISHASGELERVRGSLEGLSGEFDARDADLESLLKTYQESLGPKAPEPLPLEEE